MDTEKKTALAGAGIDVEGALDRFMGNESMLERYLNRFLADKSYAELANAVQTGNRDLAKTSAHTLKSVCGSIGCVQMSRLVIDQEQLMRDDRWDDACAMMDQVAAEYDRICAAIRG